MTVLVKFAWYAKPAKRTQMLRGRIHRGWSSQRDGELGEIHHDQIRLMRCLAEWPPAPVDKGGPHAVGFCSDAVEGVIGDEQDAGAILANNLHSLGIRLPMRLETAGLLYGNDVVEAKPDVRRRGVEHVAVAVRKDCQLIACGPEPLESGHNVGK